MSLNHEFQISEQLIDSRLNELKNDGNQAFKGLVDGHFISAVSSFYMTQLPNGLISLAVLADSKQAGDSLWFDEIYSPEDSIQLIESLVGYLDNEGNEPITFGDQAVKWINDKAEFKLPFKVIEGVNQDIGTILNSFRDVDEI